MYIFDLLTKIFITITVIVLIGGVIFFAVFMYAKTHKPSKESENDSKYADFKRKNAKTYVPFDTIRDDVMIFGNYSRFLTAVSCRGFDFFDSHPAEQLLTIQGYQGFINTIDKPIQKRIHCRKVDLESPIERHKQVIEEYKLNLLTFYTEGATLEEQLKAASEEERGRLEKESKRLFNEVKRMEREIKHLDHVCQYMQNMSGVGAAPVQEESYIFDWTFNPNDFPNGITDEEIFVRAKKELEAKANQVTDSLKNCGVRSRRSREDELIECTRRHFQPYGSDLFKMNDIEKSNYDTMIVSSRSLEDAEKRYYDTVREEMFAGMVQGNAVEEAV